MTDDKKTTRPPGGPLHTIHEHVDDAVEVDDDVTHKYRSKICRFFLRGDCIHGDNCTYSHDVTVAQREPIKSCMSCKVSTAVRHRPFCKGCSAKFKSMHWCRYWVATNGDCDYGTNCRFAHGVLDNRPICNQSRCHNRIPEDAHNRVLCKTHAAQENVLS